MRDFEWRKMGMSWELLMIQRRKETIQWIRKKLVIGLN